MEDFVIECSCGVIVISKTRLNPKMVPPLCHLTNTSSIKIKCLIPKELLTVNISPFPVPGLFFFLNLEDVLF